MRAAEVVPIYLRVAPGDIALLKFLIESYEGIAVVRTIERRAAVIVILAVPDFLSTVRAALTAAAQWIAYEEVPPPAERDLGPVPPAQ
ncbi:MAG: DUF4911 domain-containing protein [Deltaproteobacteria bacterium]|nr:DUF4911 domain-containing protein [Deltaproteobacteria bacterium]